MREADVDRALGSLALAPGALVLDTAAAPARCCSARSRGDATWRGLGVDLDPDAIAEARARAAERLPGRDVRSRSATGRGQRPPQRGPQRRLVARPRRLPGGVTRSARARGRRRDRGLRQGLLARAAVRRVPRGARRRDGGRARQPRRPAVERAVRGLRHRVAHRGGQGRLGRLRGDARRQRRARRGPGDGRVRAKGSAPAGPCRTGRGPSGSRCSCCAPRGRGRATADPRAAAARDGVRRCSRPSASGPRGRRRPLEPDLDDDRAATEPAAQRLGAQGDPVDPAAHRRTRVLARTVRRAGGRAWAGPGSRAVVDPARDREAGRAGRPARRSRRGWSRARRAR